MLDLDDDGSLTWMLTCPDPPVVNDWNDETRCSQSITTRALGVRSSDSMTVRTGNGIWGLLKGCDRQVRDFTVHDATLARGISRLVAAAVERRDFEALLLRQAVHDPFTGLPNRSLLVDRLTAHLQPPRRRTGGACFSDLDDFSAINDRCGYAVTDQVMAEAARRLVAQVRHGDTVAA
jgi:diguanylate cyclase (GGDEF) domain